MLESFLYQPIYHQKHDAIKAHVLICFVALMVEKYLELTTKLSLREIRFLVMNITEIHIQDQLTKETFTFRSPTKHILATPLADLISNTSSIVARDPKFAKVYVPEIEQLLPYLKRGHPKLYDRASRMIGGAKAILFNCEHPWQKAKDNSRCGKRAKNVSVEDAPK